MFPSCTYCIYDAALPGSKVCQYLRRVRPINSPIRPHMIHDSLSSAHKQYLLHPSISRDANGLSIEVCHRQQVSRSHQSARSGDGNERNQSGCAVCAKHSSSRTTHCIELRLGMTLLHYQPTYAGEEWSSNYISLTALSPRSQHSPQSNPEANSINSMHQL